MKKYSFLSLALLVASAVVAAVIPGKKKTSNALPLCNGIVVETAANNFTCSPAAALDCFTDIPEIATSATGGETGAFTTAHGTGSCVPN